MTSHAMARRKLHFEYVYCKIQILNASCVLVMNISTEIYVGILFSDNVLSNYHIKIKYKHFFIIALQLNKHLLYETIKGVNVVKQLE